MSDAAPQNETALQGFLAYLQNNGFPCGVGERVRAFRVVEHFGQQNPSPRWNSLLGPIFARNPGEQQRFHQAFEEFFREGPRKELPQAIPGQPRLEPPPEWREEPPRHIPWRLVGIALLISFCIGAFFYWDAPGWLNRLTQSIALPKPPPPPGYPPPELTQSSPDAERSYRRIVRRELASDNRPCQRWECVTSGWRPWVVAAPLALLLLFALFVQSPTWRRAQLRHRESRRVPPFSWPPFRGRPRFAGYRDLLANAAQVMSKRLAADSDQLDVPATIRATIRAAGFPSIRFRKDQKAPEYLFLIERRAPGDHFAAWWTALADELRALGVRIDCYYHGGDSQLFRSANNAVNVTAHRLLDLHPHHSVLLLGECSTLLNPYSGELTSWAASLDARDNRAVLTPEPGFEWGLPEALVKRRLTLLPARVRNLPAMLKSFDSFGAGAATLETAEADETAAMPDSALRDFDPDAQEELERAGRALRFHLDSDVFEWLCACAVHPDLQWELTMELGRVVDPSGALFSEPKLLQLIRLKWFREGAIPGPWRAWLVKHLDPAYERTVRELLIGAQLDYRAPENSFAHDWQDLQVAAQRYWLSPQDPQRRLELELVMSTLPAVDIDRDYLLARLRAEWRARPAAQRLAGEQRKGWHNFKESGWKFAALGLSVTALLAGVAIRTPVEYERYVSLPPTYEVVFKPVSTPRQQTVPEPPDPAEVTPRVESIEARVTRVWKKSEKQPLAIWLALTKEFDIYEPALASAAQDMDPNDVREWIGFIRRVLDRSPQGVASRGAGYLINGRRFYDVYFDHGSDKLRPDALATLKQLLPAIQSVVRDGSLILEGASDSVEEDSLKLRRTEAVKRYLNEAGIPTQDIVMRKRQGSYGNCDTDECFQRYRYVKFLFAKTQTENMKLIRLTLDSFTASGDSYNPNMGRIQRVEGLDAVGDLLFDVGVSGFQDAILRFDPKLYRNLPELQSSGNAADLQKTIRINADSPIEVRIVAMKRGVGIASSSSKIQIGESGRLELAVRSPEINVANLTFRFGFSMRLVQSTGDTTETGVTVRPVQGMEQTVPQSKKGGKKKEGDGELKK